MKILLTCTLAITLITLITSPILGDTDQMPEKVKAFVSILPQAYFVERVGGRHVDVSVLVGPGQDAHTYELSPKMVAELAKAKVFFGIGLPFEVALVKKISSTFNNLQVVDTAKGITFRVMQEGEEHDHGERDDKHAQTQDGQGHERGETDPHIWMDPKMVKVQIANIANALSSLDPSHSLEYRNNSKEFQAELDELDSQLARVLGPVRGKKFYVYHPAYGYFGDSYGLKQVSVETGGKEPSARHLAALIREAKKDEVRVIFVQPQFSKKSAESLAKAIGGAVVALDPLARDYLKNMREVAEKVESALAAQKNPINDRNSP
jgi:zinc transport system substrate-binding protein